jgi:hypothetical protein
MMIGRKLNWEIDQSEGATPKDLWNLNCGTIVTMFRGSNLEI